MNHPALLEQRSEDDITARAIGFLFNHDHVHQIAHAASIGFSLSEQYPNTRVIFITTSARQRKYLMDLAAFYTGHHCEFTNISIPWHLRTPALMLDKILPFTRIAMLKHNLGVFKGLDALVVTDKTSLYLRNEASLNHLKLIHTRHGAGDRAIGFDKASGQFDLILLSGNKIRDRLDQSGALRCADYSIVGYPKFDAVQAFTRTQKPLFNNDRPTVLYNPHCSPHLSSWYRMGTEILDYFYHSREYNLIFAPHVMLFRRKLHISLDKLSLGWRRSLPDRYRNCGHIHVDTDSVACTDMTYSLAADIYLGDVSSQVWEFLLRPRPCLFVNAHRIAWEDDPNYLHWHTGPVIDRIEDLHRTLEQASAFHGKYRGEQEKLFRYTMDIRDKPSSDRAAGAIRQFLDKSMGERTSFNHLAN